MNEHLNNVIVLIYPYFKTEDNLNQKLFNPLGIALLSAQLKLKEINVIKIDCTFKKLEDVINEIIALKPKIIGFYTMITLTQNIYNILKSLKLNLSQSLYICGGPLATIFPQIFAKEFDIVFKGEMDDSFSEFVSKYFRNNLKKEQFIKTIDLSDFSGIYIEKNMIFFENKAIHLTETQFKALPLPDREGFDHQNYQKFWQEREGIKATNIIVTVGCPYHCDFCSKPIFGDNLRKRNIKDIIYEIEIVKTMGYNYFWISDDCFTLNVIYLEEFCDELIAKNLKMNWCCLSRADKVDFGVLKKMKRSGCEKVYLGLESGNNEILKIMKKNTTVEKGKNGVELIKKAGIKVAGFFIVGYPEESWETIDQTFKYALELDLDEVSFNVPYPLPGTALFERISTIDMSKDWTIENEIKFIFKSKFDESRIKEKIDRFYKRYHHKKKTKSILSYE